MSYIGLRGTIIHMDTLNMKMESKLFSLGSKSKFYDSGFLVTFFFSFLDFNFMYVHAVVK